MRAGWLSYIRNAYPEDAADNSGPIVGEGIFVVQDWVYAAAGCDEQRSPGMDDAIGLLSSMNSNPNCDFLFCNNANNGKYNGNNSDIMQNDSTKVE